MKTVQNYFQSRECDECIDKWRGMKKEKKRGEEDQTEKFIVFSSLPL